jgi:phage portal protein BeeE
MRLSLRRRRELVEQRVDPALSVQSFYELLTSFSYNGVQYTLPGDKQEQIQDYQSLTRGAYKSDSVVFACMDVRSKLFSEARFQFRQIRNGRPGELFGTSELEILEVPWPNGTTGDLLMRMIQYADLAGNAFVVRRPTGVALLRPDWVDIVTGAPGADSDAWSPDAVVVGYVYHPGGRSSSRPAETFLPAEVAHFAPIPDPEARFRGMSWLTPVIREIMADKAGTLHKQQFFENAATPNLVVKFDLDSVEKMRPWIELFRENHEGSANAYKTLFLNAGTDATAIGHTFQEMEFKVTQGAGETRIAAAAGTPPVIVGLSEGLAAATYSNYGLAMRRFADVTMRPLWRNVAASLAPIVNVPSGAELWYDDRDVPALADDGTQKAQILATNTSTLHTLVSAGFEPDSAIDAVISGDLTKLEHTGLYSVQLQPAGSVTQGKGALVAGVVAPENQSAPPAAPSTNGAGAPVPA